MRSRRGNFNIIVAVSLTALIGFSALAVDFSRSYSAKAQMQANVDAATLAAMVVYRDSVADETLDAAEEGTDAANWIFDQNLVAEQRGKVKSTVRFGTWDWDETDKSKAFVADTSSDGTGNNAVEVTGVRTRGEDTESVDTLLAPLFGGPDHIDVSSTGTGAFRYRDVVVIFDSTRSLDTDEVTNEANAARTFLETIRGQQLPGDKVSLVTFTGEGSIRHHLTAVGDTTIDSDWEALRNCSVDSDQFYSWESGTYDHWMTKSPTNRDVFPYAWHQSVQAKYKYDWNTLLDGGDGLGGVVGKAEAHFVARNDGSAGSSNDSYGSTLPPCYYGRDGTDFYGPDGYWMNNYPNGPKYYPKAGTGDAKVKQRGRKYSRSGGVDVDYDMNAYYSDTGTNQWAALTKARAELADTTTGAREGALKIMVLMTDGLPESGQIRTSYRDWETKSQWLEDEARDLAAEICEEGTTIFSISYNTQADPDQEARMTDFMRDMAEDPYPSGHEYEGEPCNYGAFYETSDSSTLPQILAEVAKRVPIVMTR